MLDDALGGLIGLLAFAGGAALVARLARASIGVALRAAEAAAARGMADVSARRGDVTGMMERQSAAREARRALRLMLLLGAVWLAWLVVPLFAGVARHAYAAAALLWLAPNPRLRMGPKPDENPLPPG